MKSIVVLFAILALGLSAPQPRKIFHEHVEEFLDIIFEDAGPDLDHLMEHYQEFEEFQITLDYMRTSDFKNLVYEMESLPEFKAMTDFLEKDNIDILFFIDLFNNVLEQYMPRSRHELSGKDFKSFITDCISEFPKAKLAALFDQKMAEEDEFRTAIENLQSDEWNTIWSALWENETFKAEAKILSDNGIDLLVLVDEILAVFGQK